MFEKHPELDLVVTDYSMPKMTDRELADSSSAPGFTGPLSCRMISICHLRGFGLPLLKSRFVRQTSPKLLSASALALLRMNG